MKHVCNREGCAFPASRYPKVRVMPRGYRRGQCEPLTLLLPMAICVAHQGEFDVQQFLGAEARETLRRALLNSGKAPADFDSAWVEWARIGDADWINLHMREPGETVQ